MKKRILDVSDNGITQKFYKEDGKIIIDSVQDTKLHEKFCREMRKTYNDGSSEGLLASIPLVIIEKWNQELPAGRNCLEPEYKQFLRNKINSPEYENFRVKKGKI